MKYTYLCFLLSITAFSQSISDRKTISNSYSIESHLDLKNKHKRYLDEQSFYFSKFKVASKNSSDIADFPQKFIDGKPIFYAYNNNGDNSSSGTIGAVALYSGGSLGLSVNGSGITVGIWDGGGVLSTHQEFSSRVTQIDNPTTILSDHSTHVAGTICASGFDLNARGIAYGASLSAYDWNADYDEMLDFGFNGGLVSNHSYGYRLSNISNWLFGAYDDTSLEMDNVTSTYPYYQVVFAAGNYRSSTSNSQVSAKNGYDLLSGACTAKNVLVVAAVEGLTNYDSEFDVIMSSFSNYGPTDDGRIKPDISAKGVDVYSAISTGATEYSLMSGTSMASPGITGLIALLQRHYYNVNSKYMKSSLVRGLLCHSAREAGSDLGPDYGFGWGLANGKVAASIISDISGTALLELNQLTQGSTFTKTFNVSSSRKLDVTISWTDLVGTLTPTGTTDSRSSKLINNLDLKIKKNGVVYYPWKLNPLIPTNAATRNSDNEVDNIEKVQIDLADPGEYTIEVSHKGSLQGGSQEFALIATGFDSLLENNSFDFNNNVVIYPNPATNLLNFSTPSGDVLSNVAIYDSLGKEIKISKSVLNNTLDISELSNGLYIAKFFHNGKLMVNKFIKK